MIRVERTVRPPPRELSLGYRSVLLNFLRRVIYVLSLLPEGTVTSWYRDPERNRAVGGAPRSLHLLGLAVDIAGADTDLVLELAYMAGLHAVDETDKRGHVHLQAFAPGTLRA